MTTKPPPEFVSALLCHGYSEGLQDDASAEEIDWLVAKAWTEVDGRLWRAAIDAAVKVAKEHDREMGGESHNCEADWGACGRIIAAEIAKLGGE
jgi:hypothetical protein